MPPSSTRVAAVALDVLDIRKCFALHLRGEGEIELLANLLAIRKSDLDNVSADGLALRVGPSHEHTHAQAGGGHERRENEFPATPLRLCSAKYCYLAERAR
eukprot:8228906-Pyramimonas_sp.AAC.1